MAFNSTADLKLTAGDIITEALELCGILAEGESASTAQNTSSLRTLNNIVKVRSADTQIFAQAEYTLDLVASTGSYQLGTGNVGYIPNRVQNAVLIDSSGNEIPLSPLTQEEWYGLSNKTTESIPTQYFQHRRVVGVDLDLHLWPVPKDTAYDLKLWLQYPIRDVDLTTDDVWFTQEWYMALSFELAHILSFKYTLPLAERDRIKIAMDEYIELASTYDTDGSVFLQVGSKHA